MLIEVKIFSGGETIGRSLKVSDMLLEYSVDKRAYLQVQFDQLSREFIDQLMYAIEHPAAPAKRPVTTSKKRKV